MSLIKSVIGWDMSSSLVTKEKRVLKGGYSTVHPCEKKHTPHTLNDGKWFTNFDQDLLNKVLDYKRNNI